VDCTEVAKVEVPEDVMNREQTCIIASFRLSVALARRGAYFVFNSGARRGMKGGYIGYVSPCYATGSSSLKVFISAAVSFGKTFPVFHKSVQCRLFHIHILLLYHRNISTRTFSQY
jgi:hypothetical protein